MSRIERIMKQIHQIVKIVINDSKQYYVTRNNYLLGGLLNIIFNKCSPIIQQQKITKGRLGNWSAIALEYNGKRVELINLYRILLSSSNGVSCLYTQYILVDKCSKTVSQYRKEVLKEIKQHIQNNQEITDIIIARDYNQDIKENEIRNFYNELGVRDIHSKVNNIPLEQLDRTYKQGSKPIDSIAATTGVLDYVEGCQMMDYNNIIETDHRGI